MLRRPCLTLWMAISRRMGQRVSNGAAFGADSNIRDVLATDLSRKEGGKSNVPLTCEISGPYGRLQETFGCRLSRIHPKPLFKFGPLSISYCSSIYRVAIECQHVHRSNLAKFAVTITENKLEALIDSHVQRRFRCKLLFGLLKTLFNIWVSHHASVVPLKQSQRGAPTVYRSFAVKKALIWTGGQGYMVSKIGDTLKQFTE
ncbi:hypothetical protein BU15DRAFT_67503 [Melanogaster broomeanus]|nr:hypothetical protein BU15DRAFT_67503 [Melanogaster broomeanus]